ncbi:MAG: DUF2892 domain-containing protein [Candidatus Paceibacterota bacterium]
MMKKNVGSIDRAIRVVVGLLLIWWSINLEDLLSAVSIIAGIILLVTGIIGRSLAYKFLKIKGTLSNKCEDCGEDDCVCEKCENCKNKVCVCENKQTVESPQQ